jgi:hypothetical protein
MEDDEDADSFMDTESEESLEEEAEEGLEEEAEQSSEEEAEESSEEDSEESLREEPMTDLFAILGENNPTWTVVSVPWNSLRAHTDGVARLGQSMIRNTQVRSFEMESFVLNEQQCRSLAAGIAQSELATFRVKNGVTSVQTILFDGIQASQSIRKIVLDNVPIEDLNGLEGLVMPSLQTLEISGASHWNLQYGHLVSNSLARNASLTKLSLTGCAIGDDGLIPLVMLELPSLPLTSLKIDNCGIGDNIARMLADHWLPFLTNLKTLELQENNIGPGGARQLLRAVTGCPAMQELTLTENRSIGYAGLSLIGEELPHVQLKSVVICECADYIPYTNSSSNEAIAQERAWQDAGRALIDGVRRNLHIKNLELNSIFDMILPLEISQEIDFYTKLNELGRYLLAIPANDDRALPLGGWSYILAKCRDRFEPDTAPSLIFFFLSEQPTLVQPSTGH